MAVNRFMQFDPVSFENIPIYKPNFELLQQNIQNAQNIWDQGQEFRNLVPQYADELKGATDSYMQGVNATIDQMAKIYKDQGVQAGNRAFRDMARNFKRDWAPGGTAYEIQESSRRYEAQRNNIMQQIAKNPQYAARGQNELNKLQKEFSEFAQNGFRGPNGEIGRYNPSSPRSYYDQAQVNQLASLALGLNANRYATTPELAPVIAKVANQLGIDPSEVTVGHLFKTGSYNILTDDRIMRAMKETMKSSGLADHFEGEAEVFNLMNPNANVSGDDLMKNYIINLSGAAEFYQENPNFVNPPSGDKKTNTPIDVSIDVMPSQTQLGELTKIKRNGKWYIQDKTRVTKNALGEAPIHIHNDAQALAQSFGVGVANTQNEMVANSRFIDQTLMSNPFARVALKAVSNSGYTLQQAAFAIAQHTAEILGGERAYSPEDPIIKRILDKEGLNFGSPLFESRYSEMLAQFDQAKQSGSVPSVLNPASKEEFQIDLVMEHLQRSQRAAAQLNSVSTRIDEDSDSAEQLAWKKTLFGSTYNNGLYLNPTNLLNSNGRVWTGLDRGVIQDQLEFVKKASKEADPESDGKLLAPIVIGWNSDMFSSGELYGARAKVGNEEFNISPQMSQRETPEYFVNQIYHIYQGASPLGEGVIRTKGAMNLGLNDENGNPIVLQGEYIINRDASMNTLTLEGTNGETYTLLDDLSPDEFKATVNDNTTILGRLAQLGSLRLNKASQQSAQ